MAAHDVREVEGLCGEAVSPTLGAGGGVSRTAPKGYDAGFERELERLAMSLDIDVVEKIAKVALMVAEPYYNIIEWTQNTIAITRQDGIADFIYIGDKVLRLPWRQALPILLKDYGHVIFIDLRKIVRKEKVVEALKEELDQVKYELSRLAKRKSRYAMEMKAIYEKDLDRITKALNYLWWCR